jgi:hypothetical protein
MNGSLHDLPLDVLDKVQNDHAPPQFHARVADFNDNLWYEMQSQRGLQHLGLGVVHDLLQADEYLGSFLTTESSVPQPPHVDYKWEILEEDSSTSSSSNLQIGFFPLTQHGMFLQVWPRNDDQHVTTIPGQVIYIPHGKLMVLPAHTIHGGGFRTTPALSSSSSVSQQKGGNLRFHLYLARNEARLPTFQTNKYTEPNDKTKELERRYVDAPSMDLLLEHFFV